MNTFNSLLTLCRKRISAAVPHLSEKSGCLAEILFVPSFDCHGRIAYCRIFMHNDALCISYVHFRKYDFTLGRYTVISAELSDNIFTDSFCGVVTADDRTAKELEMLISRIPSLDSPKSCSLHTDGYSHIVISGECTFYWHNADISPAAELLNSFADKVFSLLPCELRTIDFQPDIS